MKETTVPLSLALLSEVSRSLTSIFLIEGTATARRSAEPLPKTLELHLGVGIKMNLVANPDTGSVWANASDLRHLKDQAKDMLRAGQAASLANAQFQVARRRPTIRRPGCSWNAVPTPTRGQRSGNSSEIRAIRRRR